jgi:hypothetical protein
MKEIGHLNSGCDTCDTQLSVPVMLGCSTASECFQQLPFVIFRGMCESSSEGQGRSTSLLAMKAIMRPSPDFFEYIIQGVEDPQLNFTRYVGPAQHKSRCHPEHARLHMFEGSPMTQVANRSQSASGSILQTVNVSAGKHRCGYSANMLPSCVLTSLNTHGHFHSCISGQASCMP